MHNCTMLAVDFLCGNISMVWQLFLEKHLVTHMIGGKRVGDGVVHVGDVWAN